MLKPPNRICWILISDVFFSDCQGINLSYNYHSKYSKNEACHHSKENMFKGEYDAKLWGSRFEVCRLKPTWLIIHRPLYQHLRDDYWILLVSPMCALQLFQTSFGVHTALKNPRRGMVRPRYRPASVLKDVDYFKMSAFATATKCLCLNRVLVYLHLMDRLKKYPLFFF